MSDRIYNSTTTSNKVSTPNLETENIILGTENIKKLEHDHNISDMQSVASAKALYDGLKNLQKNIDQIDPDNILFRDNSVISLPLLTPIFSADNDEWEYSDWIFLNEQAHYLNQNSDNYLTINNNYFTYVGIYFLIIDVQNIESGVIKIYDNEKEIATIVGGGKHYLEFIVDDPNIYTITLKAENVFPDDTIIINSINLHYVTERIQDYLIYAISQISSGSMGGYATVTYVNNIVASLNNKIDLILEQLNQLDLEPILGHIGNFDNPHQVTYTDVNAPSLNQFNNHLNDHTNPHQVTSGQIGAVAYEDFLLHSNDINNPHKVTATQINAITIEDFNNHIHNYNNPHRVSASQVNAISQGETIKLSDLDGYDELIERIQNIETNINTINNDLIDINSNMINIQNAFEEVRADIRIGFDNDETLYIDLINGSDDTGEGYIDNPWQTIEHALNELNNYDGRGYVITLNISNFTGNPNDITIPTYLIGFKSILIEIN